MKHFFLSLVVLCAFVTGLQAAAPMIVKVPSLSVANTNYVNEEVVTNGITLGGVRNTSWPAGGSAPVGTVINSVAVSGLLSVDAVKTNGIAATFAHVTNALGFGPVNKAGDTMTGPLLVTGLTNSARTASTFVVAASDKSDTSTATSAVLAATLSDETGSGVAVFATSPALVTPALGVATATSLVATNGILIPSGTLTHAGTMTLDLTQLATVKTMIVTGDVTFALSNLAADHTYQLRVLNTQATNVALTFPSPLSTSITNWCGGKPTTLTLGTSAMWSIRAFSATSGDVICAWSQTQ